MAANFRRIHTRHTYANAGSAITAGSVVTVVSGNSGYIGVAQTDIAATTGTGEIDVLGVYDNVPKTTGEAFTDGQLLYWTGTALTGASTGNTRAGRAYGAAASADAVAALNLNAI